jgi:2,4-dienoyl-CoA reductase (NADPH2)
MGRTVTAWDVLSGAAKVEEPALVLGAGLVGCETADFLSEQGKKVFLVEILPEMGTGADGDTKAYFNLKFLKNDVEVLTSTEVIRFEGSLAVLKRGEEVLRREAKTVIFAVGAVPEEGSFVERVSFVPKVIRVGDCVKPRRILDAVREGFDAGNL